MGRLPNHEIALNYLADTPTRDAGPSDAAALDIATAQVHATLAVAEQLARIAELLADLPTRLNP